MNPNYYCVVSAWYKGQKYSLQRSLIWFPLFEKKYISLIVEAWLIAWFLGKYKHWEKWDCNMGRVQWEESWTQNCNIQHNVRWCVSLLGKWLFGYSPKYGSETISYSISNYVDGRQERACINLKQERMTAKSSSCYVIDESFILPRSPYTLEIVIC